MGLITLLVGPILATAVTVLAASRPTAVTAPPGSAVERTGRSVLSVGHVVATRAAEPVPVASLAPVSVSPVPALIAPTAPLPLPPAPTALATPSPAPSPSPTPSPRSSPRGVSAPAGSVAQIILSAATSHGVDGAWMLRIARCESGLNTRAYNPAGPWIGLFQFAPSTFRAHGGTDIYSADQQANIAAAMLKAGQAHQWPVCSLR